MVKDEGGRMKDETANEETKQTCSHRGRRVHREKRTSRDKRNCERIRMRAPRSLRAPFVSASVSSGTSVAKKEFRGSDGPREATS